MSTKGDTLFQRPWGETLGRGHLVPGYHRAGGRSTGEPPAAGTSSKPRTEMFTTGIKVLGPADPVRSGAARSGCSAGPGSAKTVPDPGDDPPRGPELRRPSRVFDRGWEPSGANPPRATTLFSSRRDDRGPASSTTRRLVFGARWTSRRALGCGSGPVPRSPLAEYFVTCKKAGTCCCSSDKHLPVLPRPASEVVHAARPDCPRRSATSRTLADEMGPAAGADHPRPRGHSITFHCRAIYVPADDITDPRRRTPCSPTSTATTVLSREITEKGISTRR